MTGPTDAGAAKKKKEEVAASSASGYQKQLKNGLLELGRELTPEEKKKIGQNYEGTSVSTLEAQAKYVGNLNSLAKKVLREAQAAGLDMSPEEAAALRDQFYEPGQASKFNETLRNALEGRVTQGVQDKQKEEIDRVLNPGKYIDDAKRTENDANAQRLLKQSFGEDFNDPDFQSFISERLAGGESPFEISQFLQTTPQYMEKKAAKDREMINQELLAGEEEVFAKATPQIISSYMKAGRLGSSGLNSALAKARTELASQRQAMQTGYAREDVVGARNAAFQGYLRQSEPGYQQQFAARGAQNFNSFQQPYNTLNRQYQLNDEARNRQYQVEDYDRQQSDFNRYLSDSRRQSRESALYGLLGAGVGAGIQGLTMRP